MILYGQYDSPFVRRVAVSLHFYGLPFTRRVLSVYGDAEAVRAVNPLGRVPALALEDGILLFDSACILDHLDQMAGPEAALTPLAGPGRMAVQRLTTTALGLAEKGVAYRGEAVRRSEALRDPGQITRLRTQIESGLDWLEAAAAAPWLYGASLSQADVTAAVTLTYLEKRLDPAPDLTERPRLAALRTRCEALEAFRKAPFSES